MKQTFKPLILVLLTLLPATALAHDFEVNGIYYNINGTKATVTYQGTYPYSYSNEYTGDVTIPTNVTYGGTTYSITSIGYAAFQGCMGLTSVTIPNSVTIIGDFAFDGCKGLASVPIPNSVTTIGDYAFEDCSSLTSVIIPNSVTAIGGRVFCNCYSLTSITVESGNSSYDSRNNCNAIIETATNKLIAGCKSTTIPNSVTSIGDGAFNECSGLTSITIGNSVTTIGDFAFYGCSGLTSINIPNSVTTIGVDAFYSTSWFDNQPDGLIYAGLVAYKYNGEMPTGTSITLRDSTQGIAGGAFYGCSGLTSINIPNSVTTIGNYAFNSCNGLTTITIPNSVTYIGEDAFEYCSGLTNVTIGNSVTQIDHHAFGDCNGLTSVTCLAITPPSTYYTFYYEVTSQATLYVPKESVSAYQSADNWKDFSQIIGIITIDDFEVEGVWYRALDENTAMVISRPDENDLYSGDVVIPEEVTYEGYTFTVTAIDEGAFEDCYELNSVVIGDAVETIGVGAFQGCTDLTSVTIGSGVTSIGAKAFNYCNALQTVTCRGTVPPVMASSNCFTNATYNRATLIVPRQQIETYATADYWYKFSHIEGWGSAGLGDANGDGYITISDVTAIINILLTDVGIDNPDADLNHNGVIDIGDVTTLIHFLLTQ